jgi:glutamate racemase
MATIGIFDSGIGGLSVLREVRKLLPEEDYIYFSDNAYCPYGKKDPSLIIDRAREISDFLIFKGADVIIVACNTATGAAISTLREEYSTPDERIRFISKGRLDHVKFVGMEPAIKPAAQLTRSGVVGVLATAGTLAAGKYHNTKESLPESVKFVEHVGEGFVEQVESLDWHSEDARKVVEASLRPLLDQGADCIVLGCTHYPFLAELIQDIAGPEVKVIDSAPAIARQLLKVIKEENIPYGPDGGGNAKVSLYASGSRETLEKTFALISAD